VKVLALDWSGRDKRAAEHIWLAVVDAGRLVELDNGRDRGEVVDEVVARAGRGEDIVVGLDFAFSFPRWYCQERGWGSGRDVWTAIRDQGESLLASCEPPFWGRTGTTAQTQGPALRATDTGGAKSVFQIGGAGAVGTGSIRGMPHLLRLSDAGFAVWPFDPPRLPAIVEIYPRLLTGKVDKGRNRTRRAYLDQHFADQDPVLRERAAGSEDAFDAAVSALVMGAHLTGTADLPTIAPDDPRNIEGAIWSPTMKKPEAP